MLGGAEDFGSVSAIALIGDTLMLVGDRFTDPHLSVVNIESGSVIARFGARGEGPTEFKGPHSILPDPAQPDLWWVYDFSAFRLTPVALAAGEWSINPSYSLAGLPASPETPIWTGPDALLVQGVFDFAFARVTLDSQSRQVANWERVQVPQPFTDQDMPMPVWKSFLNRSYVGVRPDGDRFVMAYQFVNQIEVRSSSDGELVAATRGPHEATASYRMDESGRFYWEQDNQSGYTRAYGTDDFFFLHWCGCYDMVDDYEDNMVTIHQFDWDGNFVRELVVDEPISAFAVSSAEDRLWGFLQQGIPYPGIAEWIIPPLP